MLAGHNYIGFTPKGSGKKSLRVFSTLKGSYLPEAFTIATNEEIEAAAVKAASAFAIYKKTTFEQRAVFLETIAAEIIGIGEPLIQRAMLETGLPEARLTGERGRTVNQLKLFAEVMREGSWVEAVIDTALPDRAPLPRPDLRKMLVPLGPVAVFGASNFPFAFSTAGGDTASALAAGCPVIVKAHDSHLGTNELVANAIIRAAQKCQMPDGVFSSLIGEGPELGQLLAKHPVIRAIGFTGSSRAGMSIYKTAVNERKIPIPVYAEMSSINPVLLLPQKLEEEGDKAAAMLAGSIILGVGQFCTNPGLLFVINNKATDGFIRKLSALLEASPEATMLNKAICSSYYGEREKLLAAQGVSALFVGKNACDAHKGTPALLEIAAEDFIKNEELQQEVFGPLSLIIKCNSKADLLKAIESLEGQLTGTVLGTNNDLEEFSECIDVLKEKVGRILYNGVPTGVEVCYAMVHGGPFPATSDSRSTSVGADALKRFVRPVCFQDCPEEFLPDALKGNNPLAITRRVNGHFTTGHS
jgi:NADP-dependent aldehyde dehydrogenase